VLCLSKRPREQARSGNASSNIMNLDNVKRLAVRTLPEPALLQLKKMHYARVLRRSTGTEEPELAVLSQLVFPGNYVLDIGANFGRYTYHISRLAGEGGKVFSMEPIPSTFKILRSNVSRLRLQNVVCVNQAASNTTDFVRMDVPEYNTGGKNFYEAHIVSVGGGAIPCIMLDDAYFDLPQLDFIKCDVEGHEFNVLIGARKLIAQFRPTWLIEISGDPDEPATNASQTFRFLQHLGYRPYVAANGELRLRREHERTTNYFFLPE
jgi:FkbM family methyltransferase